MAPILSSSCRDIYIVVDSDQWRVPEEQKFLPYYSHRRTKETKVLLSSGTNFTESVLLV